MSTENTASGTTEKKEQITEVAVGLDIGRSGVKLVFNATDSQNPPEEIVFPPCAMPASVLADEAERRRAAPDTVIIDGQSWWFGQTAQIQSMGGAEKSGNFASWAHTEDYKALTHGALKRVRDRYPKAILKIACALPSESTSKDRDAVVDMTREVAGSHCKVTCQVQPEGIFFQHVANNPALSESGVNVLVIDVGRYSTDFAVISGGSPVRNAYRSVPGVARATDILWDRLMAKPEFGSTKRPSIERLETALMEHSITLSARKYELEDSRKAVNSLAQEILRATKEVIDKMTGGIDHILLAGGGAPLVSPIFQEVYGIEKSSSSRFIVAKGLFQRACYIN
ncbi:MAG: ParM/StbA family protein [Marinospirillum sp.]|nr:ParM/StbA family protein [Marinospirillum sp.]